MLFTSESVTEGHPDKVCDQISDAVLDDILSRDKNARVAVECAIKSGLVFVFGEVHTDTWSDAEAIARKVIHDIGYTRSELGFDYEACGVISSISEQSREIANGVNERDDHEQGAGDQGMMFGYACRDTENLMPLPIDLAHRLTKKLDKSRKSGSMPFLRPDGKSQITCEYENGKPKRIHTVLVSAQHEKMDLEELKKAIKKGIILEEIGDLIDEKTIIHINPAGSFTTGGPMADAGLTGRKIIVDTYGGMCSHGGGAFSGKDASKVDRSGAYVARYIAKNIVASGLAEKCQVQISYAIGMAEPISINAETFGTGKVSDEKLEKMIYQYFPVKPAEIIAHFDLKRPIFQKTASYGHFGRSEFPWEKTDLADKLKI